MLYEYFRPFHKFGKQSGLFGIEIETETLSHRDYGETLKHDQNTGEIQSNPKSSFWKIKPDGSLRNYGLEYVLAKPLDLKGVREALDEFKKIFGKVPFLKDAPATSVHVHLNVQSFTARELGNLVVLWTLFENILVEYSGEPRRSNLFTLPMRCAEGNVRTAVSMFAAMEKKSKFAFGNIGENENKYAALNLAALARFCSVEVRCFRGETDVEEIYQWIKILDRLMSYAKSKTVPPDLTERYHQNGFDFFFEVFGSESDAILGKVENPLALIERNVFYAAIIADSVSDWWKIDPVFEHKAGEKPKKTKRKYYTASETMEVILDEDHYWVSIGGNFFIIQNANEEEPSLAEKSEMFAEAATQAQPTPLAALAATPEQIHAWINEAPQAAVEWAAIELEEGDD